MIFHPSESRVSFVRTHWPYTCQGSDKEHVPVSARSQRETTPVENSDFEELQKMQEAKEIKTMKEKRKATQKNFAHSF